MFRGLAAFAFAATLAACATTPRLVGTVEAGSRLAPVDTARTIAVEAEQLHGRPRTLPLEEMPVIERLIVPMPSLDC